MLTLSGRKQQFEEWSCFEWNWTNDSVETMLSRQTVNGIDDTVGYRQLVDGLWRWRKFRWTTSCGGGIDHSPRVRIHDCSLPSFLCSPFNCQDSQRNSYWKQSIVLSDWSTGFKEEGSLSSMIEARNSPWAFRYAGKKSSLQKGI